MAELRGAEAIIRQGTKDVLAQRRRLTATLKEHIVNNDVLQERELDRALRGINRELAKWMETAGPRATVPVELLPPTMKVGHLRERLWDPASAAPPPPLEDIDDEQLDRITEVCGETDELRERGFQPPRLVVDGDDEGECRKP